MKNYAKILLYAYPLLKTVGKDYEEHIKNRALLSYDSRKSAVETVEYLAEEIIAMRRLEWLKAKIEEVLSSLTAVDRTLVEVRYFGKRGARRLFSEGGARGRGWTERTYFRKQQKLGERLGTYFLLAGLTEEVYLRDYAPLELFAKIQRCVEEGKDKKISARERRFMGFD